MPIHIVRLGGTRVEGEGLRIGTVRRPPRGVPKVELAARNFYDVWLPDLAPSEELLKFGRAVDEEREDFRLSVAKKARSYPFIMAGISGSMLGSAEPMLDESPP
jgi:uncharacterized protein YeaO (DUF488 family)